MKNTAHNLQIADAIHDLADSRWIGVKSSGKRRRGGTLYGIGGIERGRRLYGSERTERGRRLYGIEGAGRGVNLRGSGKAEDSGSILGIDARTGE